METRSRTRKGQTGSQSPNKQRQQDDSRDDGSADDTDNDDNFDDSSSSSYRASSSRNDDSVDGDISYTSASPSGRRTKLYPDLSGHKTPSPRTQRGKSSKLYPNLDRPSPERTSPRKPRPTPTKDVHTHDQNNNKCLYFAIISVIITAIFVSFYQSKDNILEETGPESGHNVYNSFKSNLKELQKAFSHQDRKLWTAILAPLKRVLSEDEPTHPAVLLFVVPRKGNSPKTASCLARKVVAAINTSSSAGYIDSYDLRHSDEAYEKKVLDEKLREVLNSVDQYGVVVDHIEELSPFAMLLFHGYCDGDNAPFKKSAIILVIHIDKDLDSLQNEANVDDYLHTAWTRGLEEDKVPPLIARVANNKVVIKEEEDSVLKQHCGLF